ncbi:hypothetical protein Tco_1045726 [Tanacetum coccineum]|uniref:Uncharacterized protein n=1 Tax=Tanacetum coccineum TaxID=301880 RepID=A0ABQ5GUR6_9ASTR
MELHDVSYGIEYVARPLLLFFSSEINFLLGLLKWTYALYLLGLLVSAGMDTLKSTNLPTTTSKLHQTSVEQIRIILQESKEELGKDKQEGNNIEEVTPDAVDNSRTIFDVEPLQKVQNDNDNYNVFANDREHPEQPEYVNVTYLKEHDDINIITDSLDMSNNGGEADQDDDDHARERDLLASLIEKLKCEIDESKDRNKLLESSNKTLIEKLKSEIKDFKNKNECLESSNIHFKEANTELAKNK